jgi:hypothetical protein
MAENASARQKPDSDPAWLQRRPINYVHDHVGARDYRLERDGETPMAVADLLPSRYYAFAGAIAVTVLASMAALFDSL